METQEAMTTAQSSASVPHPSSRPALGFPLGTALLLVVIFSLSGVFSCCYHWERVQSLRRRFRPRRDDDESGTDEPRSDGIPSSPSKSSHSHQVQKQSKEQSLPVIMPGQKIPTFIAWPCPCEPLSLPPLQPSLPLQIVVVDVQIPPQPLPRRPPPQPYAALQCNKTETGATATATCSDAVG